MKRALLASVCVVGLTAAQASADYVLLLVNIGDSHGAAAGARPGAPGAFPGGPPAGFGGFRGGGPGGFPGGMGGRPPGAPGGPPGGFGGGPPGAQPPGADVGGRRGAGGRANAEDLEDQALIALAIVNVESYTPSGYVKRFESGLPVRMQHPWGEMMVCKELPVGKAVLLMGPDGKPLVSIYRQYEEKFREVFREDKKSDTGKYDPKEVLDLADWCLAHGMTKHFAELMDKLAEQDGKDPRVVPYVKLRAELNKEPAAGPAEDWKQLLASDYSKLEKPGHHYTILFGRTTIPQSQAEAALDFLELSFRGFYYWWALHGYNLPLPQQKLVAVVAERPEDFKRFQKVMTPAAVVADAFCARREELLVLAPRREDDAYESLNNFSNRWWRGGFNRVAMLQGRKRSSDVPLGAPETDRYEAQMLAVVLKALEVERNRTAATHDGTRQILFTSGLLPRNVIVPEWLLFGVGSFFETPPESPWSGIGAPSIRWLPLLKQYRQTYLRSSYDTLRQVVTDAHFRAVLPRGKDPAGHRAHDNSLRQARAAAWALVYYLAHRKPDSLLAYFREMDKMPRDMELSDAQLLACFARATGCVGASGKPDHDKLTRLADEWYRFMQNTLLESEDLARNIRSAYVEMASMIAARRQRGEDGGGRGPGGRGRGPGAGGQGPGGGQ
jgi:hypothetical protein